jgi:hypothetical protein
MFTYDFEKSELGELGLSYLNVDEAALLIVKCLFCNGDITDIKWDGESVSLFDLELDELLKDHFRSYRDRLILAINNGTLKPDKIKRDINESIVTEKTFIKDEALEDRLAERGIGLGDLYYDDYMNFQGDMFDRISKIIEVEYIKRYQPDTEEQIGTFDINDFILLQDRLRKLEAEQNHPSDQSKEKLLSTRERETLLKLIIGMAVDAYGYDPLATRSPLPKELSQILALQGIPISDDTIRKWLKEATQLWPNVEPKS